MGIFSRTLITAHVKLTRQLGSVWQPHTNLGHGSQGDGYDDRKYPIGIDRDFYHVLMSSPQVKMMFVPCGVILSSFSHQGN